MSIEHPSPEELKSAARALRAHSAYHLVRNGLADRLEAHKNALVDVSSTELFASVQGQARELRAILKLLEE